MPADSKQNTRAKQKKRIRKPPAKKPAVSKTLLRNSQRQASTYQSQGRAVEKVAKEQRSRAKRKRAEVRDVKSDADRDRATAYKKTDDFKDLRKKVIAKRLQRAFREDDTKTIKRISRASEAASAAPVLKVLDQTTRPLHAVAGAARKDVQQFKRHGVKGLVGHGSLKEAGKGIRNETKNTFSDVFTEAGWKPKSGVGKTVKGVTSFAADVALDPTTYVTGGSTSVARKTSQKAATDARKKALKQGLSKEQADRFADRAAKQAAKKAPDTRGVTVKVAGKEVPGVGRATAKAAKPVKAAARKVTPERVRTAGRNVVADVNPNSRPAGVARGVNERAIQATRTARAKIGQGERDAVSVAEGIRRQIGQDNYNRVVDAIEAGEIRKLPNELHGPAVRVRAEFKHIRRVQRRAGVKVADVTKSNPKPGHKPVKGYVYRQLTKEAAEEEAKRVAKGTVKPLSSKARKEKRRLADIRKETPGKYREDLDALAAERLAHGTTSAAKAELNRSLGELGRDVKRGKPLDLKDGEAVFQVKGSEIVKVTDKKLLDRITAPLTLNKKGSKVKNAVPKGTGGRFVILSEDVVKRATEGAEAQLRGPGIIHGFDKTTSGFKRVALATPGFHIRNLVGDSFQAYVRQPARKLPGNMVRSGRTLKAIGKEQKARQNLEPRPKPSGKTLKTGRYGKVSYEEIAHNLVQHGAARSGYTARELKELSESGGTGKGRIARAGKALRSEISETTPGVKATKQALLNREDLPRVASAIYALQNGATWEQAAKAVADTHFDYGQLTSFERNVARRILPFYTWSARNIPFTAKNVVARPGKYANFQKVREEAAAVTEPAEVPEETKRLYSQLEKAGVKLPDGWERYLTEWEQRNAGVPVSIDGHKYTISLGLPVTDLNEFPGAAGKDQAREYYQKFMSLVNPIIKNPVEFFENHSFFFRDEIQREYSPNVAAPAYVEAFPPGLRKELGIVKIQDKKTGKMVWGWPAKLDYIAKSVPGTPQHAQNLATPGADRKGKGTAGKVAAYFGVKSVPIDPARTAVGLAFARLEELAEKKGNLNQQGIGKTKGRRLTPEYQKILDQEKVLRQIAYQGRVAEGYKVLPTQGAPKKVRRSRSGGSWGDQSSGGSWGDQSSGGTWGG